MAKISLAATASSSLLRKGLSLYLISCVTFKESHLGAGGQKEHSPTPPHKKYTGVYYISFWPANISEQPSCNTVLVKGKGKGGLMKKIHPKLKFVQKLAQFSCCAQAQSYISSQLGRLNSQRDDLEKDGQAAVCDSDLLLACGGEET